MKKTILQAIAISTLSLPVNGFADNLSDSDKLFNWAEVKYSEYFYPIGAETEKLEGYILRHYLGSDTYLGTIKGDVYVYGSLFGGLLKVGTVSHFLNIINSEKPSIFRPLNDTGVTNDGVIGLAGLLGNDPNNDCSGSETYIFDCSHGRDAQAKAGTLQKIGGGIAGFDFTKLDASGNPLDANANNWSCVKDNNTGLTWETKQNDLGLHDFKRQFTWYDTNPKTNGGYSGLEHASLEEQKRCIICDSNTQAFTEKVNEEGLCGANDWRVPNKEELRSIVNYGGSRGLNADAFSGSRSGAVDRQYFPHIGGVWTSTSYIKLGLIDESAPMTFENFNVAPSTEAIMFQVYYPSSTIAKIVQLREKSSTLTVMLVRDGK